MGGFVSVCCRLGLVVCWWAGFGFEDPREVTSNIFFPDRTPLSFYRLSARRQLLSCLHNPQYHRPRRPRNLRRAKFHYHDRFGRIIRAQHDSHPRVRRPRNAPPKCRKAAELSTRWSSSSSEPAPRRRARRSDPRWEVGESSRLTFARYGTVTMGVQHGGISWSIATSSDVTIVAAAATRDTKLTAYRSSTRGRHT